MPPVPLSSPTLDGEKPGLKHPDGTSTPVQEHARQTETFRGAPVAHQDASSRAAMPYHDEIESEALFNSGKVAQAYALINGTHARRHTWPQGLPVKRPSEKEKLMEYIILHYTKARSMEPQEFNNLLYRCGLEEFIEGPPSSRSSSVENNVEVSTLMASPPASSVTVDNTLVERAPNSTPPTAIPTLSLEKAQADLDHLHFKEKSEVDNDSSLPAIPTPPAEQRSFNFNLMVKGHWSRDNWSTEAVDGMSDRCRSLAQQRHVRPGKLQTHTRRAQLTRRAKHSQNVMARRNVKGEQRVGANNRLMMAAQREVDCYFGTTRAGTCNVTAGFDCKDWSGFAWEYVAPRADEKTTSTSNAIMTERVGMDDDLKEASKLE